MINASPEVCRQLRDARRAKRWSQSDLARIVGCQQSAVSMFEKGMVTKLSDDSVRKMADALGVRIPETTVPTAPAEIALPQVGGGFCPDCACPSNLPYLAGERIFFRPSAFQIGKFCAHCGEVLETRCPACGAPLNVGACCASCGSPYVAALAPSVPDVAAWAAARRAESREILGGI